MFFKTDIYIYIYILFFFKYFVIFLYFFFPLLLNFFIYVGPQKIGNNKCSLFTILIEERLFKRFA
jgi:hypothetical protein